MEIKEFIANFADQFDETDAEVFTPETKFRDLDKWSSLIALLVMSMIDDEYDVQPPTKCAMHRLSKTCLTL